MRTKKILPIILSAIILLLAVSIMVSCTPIQRSTNPSTDTNVPDDPVAYAKEQAKLVYGKWYRLAAYNMESSGKTFFNTERFKEKTESNGAVYFQFNNSGSSDYDCEYSDEHLPPVLKYTDDEIRANLLGAIKETYKIPEGALNDLEIIKDLYGIELFDYDCMFYYSLRDDDPEREFYAYKVIDGVLYEFCIYWVTCLDGDVVSFAELDVYINNSQRGKRYYKDKYPDFPESYVPFCGMGSPEALKEKIGIEYELTGTTTDGDTEKPTE